MMQSITNMIKNDFQVVSGAVKNVVGGKKNTDITKIALAALRLLVVAKVALLVVGLASYVIAPLSGLFTIAAIVGVCALGYLAIKGQKNNKPMFSMPNLPLFK